MPAYNALGYNPSITPGETYQVWSAEQPAIGAGNASASQQVALAGPYGVGNSGFDVHGFFSGAPGTFEIDVQVSNTDVDSQYQTCANGNITTVDSTNQTFHFDGTTVKALFVRLLMRARGNAVNVTANIGR